MGGYAIEMAQLINPEPQRDAHFAVEALRRVERDQVIELRLPPQTAEYEFPGQPGIPGIEIRCVREQQLGSPGAGCPPVRGCGKRCGARVTLSSHSGMSAIFLWRTLQPGLREAVRPRVSPRLWRTLQRAGVGFSPQSERELKLAPAR